jgi:hypothetical protein
VPTAAGPLFFKAAAEPLRHEAPLTLALAEWQPGVGPLVYAADVEHGWLLMDDGGDSLRAWFKAGGPMERWEPLLADFAEAQITLAERAGQLLALRVPDRRPSALVYLLNGMLAEGRFLAGLSADEGEALESIVSAVGTIAQRLDAYGIPASLHHGDLHDANILQQDGQTAIFDWGDSSISHPFFSFRNVAVSLEWTFGLAEDDPYIERLRDIYLEPWERFASAAELREAFALAARLSPATNVLAWRQALLTVPEGGLGRYAEPIPALLRELAGLVMAA